MIIKVACVVVSVVAFILACTGVAQAMTPHTSTSHMSEVAREGKIAECMQLRATLTVQYGMTEDDAAAQARTMGC